MNGTGTGSFEELKNCLREVSGEDQSGRPAKSKEDIQEPCDGPGIPVVKVRPQPDYLDLHFAGHNGFLLTGDDAGDKEPD